MAEVASMWRNTSAPAVVELLFSEKGEAGALQIARLELQRARRARSRKRFDFWTSVAHAMETAMIGAPCEDRAKRK